MALAKIHRTRRHHHRRRGDVHRSPRSAKEVVWLKLDGASLSPAEPLDDDLVAESCDHEFSGTRFRVPSYREDVASPVPQPSRLSPSTLATTSLTIRDPTSYPL